MITRYEKVGNSWIAVNDSGHVVGIVRSVPTETPYQDTMPLKTSQNPFKRYSHIPVEAMFKNIR